MLNEKEFNENNLKSNWVHIFLQFRIITNFKHIYRQKFFFSLHLYKFSTTLQFLQVNEHIARNYPIIILIKPLNIYSDI